MIREKLSHYRSLIEQTNHKVVSASFIFKIGLIINFFFDHEILNKTLNYSDRN